MPRGLSKSSEEMDLPVLRACVGLCAQVGLGSVAGIQTPNQDDFG